MKKYVEIPIVVGLVGLLVGDVVAETLPHGEFVAVSPSPMMNIAVSNAAASTISASYLGASYFESFTPVEVKIPHDHLVVDPIGLVLPVDGK